MSTRKTLFALLISIGMGICSAMSPQAASSTTPLVSASISGTTVKLNYNSTSKVSGYEVSLKNGEKSTYKVIYTGSKTSASVTKLTYGFILSFKVRSYILVKKEKVYSEPATLTIEVKLKAPILEGKLSKSRVFLSWAPVRETRGYEIYQSDSYSGLYTLLKTTSTPKYNEKLSFGSKKYYKVRAYVTVNRKKYYSDFSNAVLISNS